MQRIEARVSVVDQGLLDWTIHWETYADGREIVTRRTHFRLNGALIPEEVGEAIVSRHGYD